MKDERLHPCEFCGYPVSQGHHPFKRSRYGNNMIVVRLCANCHELYHLVEKGFYVDQGDRPHANSTISQLLQGGNCTEQIWDSIQKAISLFKEVRNANN